MDTAAATIHGACCVARELADRLQQAEVARYDGSAQTETREMCRRVNGVLWRNHVPGPRRA
jgi:hypothetical protein